MESVSFIPSLNVVSLVLRYTLGSVPLFIKLVASAGADYRMARFGFKRGLFLYVGRVIDTDALQQRHWDINTWTDEEVKSWKDAHLASCNAIAVAVRLTGFAVLLFNVY